MWSPPYEPPPIEKIRKPQWTVENTRTTQKVVDELRVAHTTIRSMVGHHQHESPVLSAITAAIERFAQLDPKVTR